MKKETLDVANALAFKIDRLQDFLDDAFPEREMPPPHAKRPENSLSVSGAEDAHFTKAFFAHHNPELLPWWNTVCFSMRDEVKKKLLALRAEFEAL